MELPPRFDPPDEPPLGDPLRDGPLEPLDRLMDGEGLPDRLMDGVEGARLVGERLYDGVDDGARFTGAGEGDRLMDGVVDGPRLTGAGDGARSYDGVLDGARVGVDGAL